MQDIAGLEAQRSVGGRLPEPGAFTAVIAVRMVTAVTMGIIIAVIPMFGPWRVVLGVIVAASEVLANLHALERLARTGMPSVAIPIADISLTLVVLWAAPEALPIAGIVYASITALNVFWYGPRTSTVLAATCGVAMLAAGLYYQPALWVVSVVTYSICATVTIIVLHSIASSAARTRRRYDALVNGLDAVVWEQDGDGTKTFVSGNVAEALGTSSIEFGRPGFQLARVHPDDRDALSDARRRNDDGRSTETHVRILDDTGSYRNIHERVTVSLNSDGTVAGARGLLFDESERWARESVMRGHAEFIRGIPVALTVLHLADTEDPSSLQIVSMNPAGEATFGKITSASPLQSVIPISEEWVDRLASVARAAEAYESPFVSLGDTDDVFAIRAVPLPDNHVGVSFEDVTKRARLAESFRHQAHHDALTGLPNRAHFNERLAELLGGKDCPPIALLVVDLDEFKEINDALGHEYGDRVLTEFARRLGRRLRNCDLVARLGGDEFAVLLTDCYGEDHALEVAGRILDTCETHFEVGEFRFQVGASVGVAVAPTHGSDGETLLRRADSAMYRAKATGGGATLYSPGQELSTVRRLELMGDLREAIRSDAMEVHYQPRVDLRSHRTVGLEALVRWRHPRHGLLPPEEFIELAEMSGNIRELTQCVGEQAADEMESLLGKHELTLSINLSARSLYDPQLADWVEDLLANTVIAPERLCFEITETEVMDDPSRCLPRLHAVPRHGVQFSEDDIGTGYSSLAYLRELPIDEIKIDRSFVADLHRDDTIVRSVIDLGHNLGLHVVAEGVEDALTEHSLRTMGCDSAQGFHWGAAMPASTLAVRLAGAWENPVTAQ